ncbi:MAG: hypothetical protein K0Q66_762 [Chitinophagaceae bacterium]|jgi:hypothetical protein|nr:hypothetical protein [Chitinophagaceae bacterium]
MENIAMWIYILCSVAWAILVVLSVVQIIRRTDLTEFAKRVWIVIILIAPVVGLLIYYFTATPKKLV